MVIFSARRKGVLPPPLPGIELVSSLRVLGVTVNRTLSRWLLPITWLLSCRPAPVCCMRCECCARMVPRPRRCTIFSARRLSRAFSMRRQRGRACARRPTARDSTRCCDAANGSVTVAMMCLSSPTCSTPLMMTFSIASKLTLITFTSLTFLTRLAFRISSVIAHTTSL